MQVRDPSRVRGQVRKPPLMRLPTAFENGLSLEEIDYGERMGIFTAPPFLRRQLEARRDGRGPRGYVTKGRR